MQSENVSKYIVVSNGVRYCPASISSIPLVATSELHPDLLNAINFICGFESTTPSWTRRITIQLTTVMHTYYASTIATLHLANLCACMFVGSW